MTDLTLPVVKITDSLRKTLDLMRAMQVSGAVCQAPSNETWLIHVADAVVELSDNPKAVVRAAIPRHQKYEMQVVKILRQKDLPKKFPTDLLIDLTGAMAGYATPGEGIVATISVSSKDLAKALLSSPSDCYCSKNRERINGCKNGEACPNHDGGTVRCV